MVYRGEKGRVSGAGWERKWAGQGGVGCGKCTLGSRFNLFFANNSFFSLPSRPTEEGNLMDKKQWLGMVPPHSSPIPPTQR